MGVGAVDESSPGAPQTARAMAAAAMRFLETLTGAQRDMVGCDFADEERRRDWSFLPVRERDGLPIGALDDAQRKLAHELIVAGTSIPGYAKVVSVMAMEHVLRALTAARRPAAADLFDPGRYCLKVFGRPGETGTWGWQLAGHHVSLNFTVAGGTYVSPTPSLLGSEPATFGTLAPLADDEEIGFRFINSLDPGQRASAIIHHRSPPDLATRIAPRIGQIERPNPVFAPEPDYVLSEAERDILSYVRDNPKGLPGHALRPDQQDALFGIVEAFAGRLSADVAAAQLDKIERAGLVEHDNTQAAGNHIHSVWRDPTDDFGDDVLAEHYRRHHTTQPDDEPFAGRFGEDRGPSGQSDRAIGHADGSD
jgi:hypothetical protein